MEKNENLKNGDIFLLGFLSFYMVISVYLDLIKFNLV